MARKVNSSSELKVGDKVFMFTTDFPAEVKDPYASYGTVEVRDLQTENTHFIFCQRLLVETPYVVGEKYIDDSGDIYTFASETNGNAWTDRYDNDRDFDYPDRPLRQVTYGPELND